MYYYYWILLKDYLICDKYKKLYIQEKNKVKDLEKKLDEIIQLIIKIE